jgi:hypothetical protein
MVEAVPDSDYQVLTIPWAAHTDYLRRAPVAESLMRSAQKNPLFNLEVSFKG